MTLRCRQCGGELELTHVQQWSSETREHFTPESFDVEHLNPPCRSWLDRKGGGQHACVDYGQAMAEFHALPMRPIETRQWRLL